MIITVRSSATLVWHDEVNRHSFLVVLPKYSLTLLKAKDLTATDTEITVYGHKADVNDFVFDDNAGTVMPLSDMADGIPLEDYVAWLNNEVWRAKQVRQAAIENGDDVCPIES